MGNQVCSSICAKKIFNLENEVNLDRTKSIKVTSTKNKTKSEKRTSLEELGLSILIDKTDIDQTSPQTPQIIDRSDGIILIQRCYKKYRKRLDYKAKTIIENLKENSVPHEHVNALIRNSLKNIDNNEVYFSNSLQNVRSVELKSMDKKLKNLVLSLNKPHQIRNLNNIKEGFSIHEWEDGSYLKGFYLNKKLNGFVQIKTTDNIIFEGEFNRNRVDGYTVMVNSIGTTYEGTWEDNQLNGTAIELWKDGTYFEGDYFKGKRHGLGSMRFSDGSLFEGTFSHDTIEGWGIIQYKNGNKYMGEWKEDNMQGFGEYIWNDGTSYVGYWVNGNKHGFGIYHSKDVHHLATLRIFIGFWMHNQQNGVGCIVANKKIRYGIWCDGKNIKWLGNYDEAMKRFDLHYLPFRKLFPTYITQAVKLLDSFT